MTIQEFSQPRLVTKAMASQESSLPTLASQGYG